MTETPHPSISALHKQWVKLENEHHELAMAVERAGGVDLTAIRERQAKNRCGRRSNPGCAGNNGRGLHRLA
jgi:hypothetical protein